MILYVLGNIGALFLSRMTVGASSSVQITAGSSSYAGRLLRSGYIVTIDGDMPTSVGASIRGHATANLGALS